MKLTLATLTAALLLGTAAPAGSLEDIKSAGTLRIGTEGT